MLLWMSISCKFGRNDCLLSIYYSWCCILNCNISIWCNIFLIAMFCEVPESNLIVNTLLLSYNNINSDLCWWFQIGGVERDRCTVSTWLPDSYNLIGPPGELCPLPLNFLKLIQWTWEIHLIGVSSIFNVPKYSMKKAIPFYSMPVAPPN